MRYNVANGTFLKSRNSSNSQNQNFKANSNHAENDDLPMPLSRPTKPTFNTNSSIRSGSGVSNSSQNGVLAGFTSNSLRSKINRNFKRFTSECSNNRKPSVNTINTINSSKLSETNCSLLTNKQ